MGVGGVAGAAGDDFLELRPSNQSILETCVINLVALYELRNWKVWPEEEGDVAEVVLFRNRDDEGQEAREKKNADHLQKA